MSGAKKGKKWPKVTENSFHCALNISGTKNHDPHLRYTCVKG